MSADPLSPISIGAFQSSQTQQLGSQTGIPPANMSISELSKELSRFGKLTLLFDAKKMLSDEIDNAKSVIAKVNCRSAENLASGEMVKCEKVRGALINKTRRLSIIERLKIYDP